MKRMMNFFNERSRMLIILPMMVIGLLTVVSCQKDLETSTGGFGEQTGLLVSVQGIEDDQVAQVNFAMDASDKSANLKSQSIGDKGLNAITSTRIGYAQLRNKAAGANPSSRASMESDVQYRILFYYKDSGEFAKSALVKAGEVAEIMIEKDREFDWFAYSYNTKEAIADPADFKNPTFPTKQDADFLYSTGTITASVDGSKLNIMFKHKVAQLRVEIDAKQVYGEIVDIQSSINKAAYINMGDINLRTGAVENKVEYVPGNLTYQEVEEGNSLVKYASIYTADPTGMTEFTVGIQSMTVKFPNDDIIEVIDPSRNVSFKFDGFDLTPGLGKVFIGDIKLWKAMKEKKVLHFGARSLPDYGVNSGAARESMDYEKNFGSLPESYVKIAGEGFTHVHENTDLPAAIATHNPDIIIINGAFEVKFNEYQGLINYMNSGGVVLMQSDEALGGSDDQIEFLKSFFAKGEITGIDKGNGGDVYPFISKDSKDPVMNGPFGNIIGQNWGVDANPTIILQNVPEEKIIIYSDGKPINHLPFSGVTMFRHKTLGFFWIGDSGWVANISKSGEYNSHIMFPYASNNDFFPVPHEHYGVSPDRGYTVSNSIAFMNLLAWAAEYAEFHGINVK